VIRGALIGFGNVAVHGHLPGWLGRRDVAITAVSDIRPARRAERDTRLPDARWFDSPATLLDEADVDFVDICTPPSSHASLTARALGRGRHVLCEKPLVLALDELARLTRLAATAGRVLHAVHNWHHAPIVRRTHALIQEGAIGRIVRVVWHTLRTAPAAVADARAGNWRVDPALAGGGVLTDHGWHVVYVLRRWLGDDPISVSARLETRRHAGLAVEDTATLRLEFPAASAEVLLTWAADVRTNRVELTGEDGRIELQDDTLVLRRQGQVWRWACPPALSDGSTHADWFDPVVGQFIEAIHGVGGSSNLAEATLCTAVESTARESSRQGGTVLAIRSRPGIPS
jgi:predicted dehydrogenase